jgi:hypothetical protein
MADTHAVAGQQRRREKIWDDNYVLPSFLHWLYHALGYVPAAAGRNMLGIAGFLQARMT